MTCSPDARNPRVTVYRGGSINLDPILAVARYAISKGMPRGRIENLIGTSLQPGEPTRKLPSYVGPSLFASLLEDGIGRAPSIEIGKGAPFSFFGGLEQAVSLAPTGRDALRALTDNFVVFHNGLESRLEETPEHLHFSYWFDGDESDNGCCNEVVLTVLIKLMRSAFGWRGQPSEIHTRFDRNGAASVYDRFFAAPVHLNWKDRSYGAVWKKEDMLWRRPGFVRGTFERALERVSRVATTRQRDTVAVSFIELISASNICVRDGAFHVASVAATAGLGERTAQRIARRHGTSLGRLLDEARLRILREHLSRNPCANAEDLSAIAGYSDSRALRRALKAWTGQHLSQIRASHMPDPELPGYATSME